MSRIVGFAVAAALIAIGQSAAAQDRVYRCGAEGRSYSQQPCAGGTAVEVGDTRSTVEVARAQRVAEVDARLADALARQRQQSESAASRQGPVLIGYSAGAAHGATTCRVDTRCSGADGSKHGKRAKSDRVTLYRVPATP
jgi:hypothetical protein